MIAHKEEIYSRPKRTWFVTEKEKKLAAKAAKVISCFIVMIFLKLHALVFHVLAGHYNAF